MALTLSTSTSPEVLFGFSRKHLVTLAVTGGSVVMNTQLCLTVLGHVLTACLCLLVWVACIMEHLTLCVCSVRLDTYIDA